MSNRKYPRYGGLGKNYKKQHPNNIPACECCGQPAICRVWIQVSYMRGDDEDFKVCQEHLNMAKNDPERLYKEYDQYQRSQTSDDGKTGYGE